ncbi:MAG: adenosylcobalamin-dependent ribonucleoside-diphosphate reductase [Chloroflexi bacterium]|nr:adenosylcobalamin-dependent ribonucleoside-diphosphate reductase [Chloroflexota bacterium]
MTETSQATDLVVQTQEQTALRLNDNARLVLERRYLLKGPEGQPVETIEQMFRRVASHIAAGTTTWNGDRQAVENRYYELISSLRFLPNSPTFTGAGTRLGQLAACFVLPIADDMGRDESGIFQTLRDAALIQQTGGGTGFSFSRLRPAGAVVRSSGGKATGPVGFMRVFDVASEIVSQGGARRGANMAVLRIDHPDIQEFIGCKKSENAITNFNISVGITDAFMHAVENDVQIDLINPQDGAVWRAVSARQLFDEIVASAHGNGEPGVLFLDAANRDNPCPHLGEYEATNPCGEQFLLPYENCCLGSINLAIHVDYGNNGHPTVAWDLLRETVEAATRFLDDVIDANEYVPAVPQLEQSAHRSRRIGLGIMGLGDLFYSLRIRYGSEESQELAAQIMEFIRFHAMRTSIDLARERSPFPAIRGSIYDPEDLRWRPPQPLAPYSRLSRWGRPSLDWTSIAEGIREHGIRNAAQTTVAPTGTVATISGCEAYGCEPVFALSYVRHMNDNGTDRELRYVSPLFMDALMQFGVDDATCERILEQVSVTGSCQGIDEVPPSIADVFLVSSDVTADEHVRMQATIQAFVDSSISKTINFPSTATQDDVARAFRLAWQLGCKGLTVYVTGSREKVVLETERTRQGKQQPAHAILPATVRPRPHRLDGQTYRLVTPLGVAYLTVNINGDNEPFEVFLNVGKAGSDTAAVAEAIGRLISLILRIPSPISSTRRLKQVVKQLKGIGGGRPLGFGRDRVRSLPDGVAQGLAEHLGMVDVPGDDPGGEQLSLFPTGDLCPECGHAALVNEEGCRRCYACGHSEC